MKSTEIVGYQRANLGRKAAQELRNEGMVPCVLYGGNTQVSFYAPAYLFKQLIYTPDVYKVILNIEGKVYTAILQERQFHPVNDSIIHADFLEVNDDKVVKIKVPIRLMGTSKGQKSGGKLVHKLRQLTVKGAIKDVPEYVDVDITNLTLGKSIKVNSISLTNLEIIDSPANPVASVNVPRALRGAGSLEDEDDAEGATEEGASEEAAE